MTTAAVALALILIGIVLGASIGSFASVVGARGWREAARGRSRCDVCGQQLRWFELVPLLSFLLLRARCRSCGAVIGWQAFALEVAGGVLGALVGLGVTLALSP